MSEWSRLLECLPQAPDFEYDWSGLAQTALRPYFEKLSHTPQNPEYHGEGDAWEHTQQVCRELAKLEDFQKLPPKKRHMLSLAALLHDIGKIQTTKIEEDKWVSPNHSAAGMHMARTFLWTQYGLCGSAEAQNFRETVCMLVRHHMLPAHILDQDDPEKRLMRIASNGQLCEGFSLSLLCLLAEADVRGRIAPDTQELLEKVQLCAELARESSCLDGPASFASAVTQHAYLSGRQVWPQQELYDDSWGEIVLLCGLPGTGKDTWIRQNHPELPVVCMDDIRRTMRIKSTDNQGPVIQAALNEARVHLRAKQPFVWNATCVRPLTREKPLRLFEQYGARARIVYLETGWEENLRRNQSREAVVPEAAIAHMLDHLEPPERAEAQTVEWICV